MERARFRNTDGRIRIIWGLTVFEALLLLGVTYFVFLSTPGSVTLRTFITGAVVFGVYLLLGRFKAWFPGSSLKQRLTWLGQADLYRPGKDDAQPLALRRR